MNIKQPFLRFKRNISNLPGWRTNKKIIIIESDDWGSIRMPAGKVFEILTKKGIDLTSRNAERYNRYDSLATAQDLEDLFECLLSFKDKNGKHPVFTAVTIVANPDFEKIRNSEFQEYYYEPFTETLRRYRNCENSFQLWKRGLEEGIFIPQFHGREHLNVSAWLKALRNGDTHSIEAFDHGFWSIVRPANQVSFQAAFDIADKEEIKYHESVIKEGLELFYRIFGYKATYFVPPNGPINNSLNRVAFDAGILQRSIAKMQLEPLGNNHYRKSWHYLGQKSDSGIIYLTRNAFFEPSDPSRDWVDSCLNDIYIAFKWHKPAIISSHRVNYIGALDPLNRERGLTQLRILLKSILKEWPEAEFMSSDELGVLIRKANKPA